MKTDKFIHWIFSFIFYAILFLIAAFIFWKLIGKFTEIDNAEMKSKRFVEWGRQCERFDVNKGPQIIEEKEKKE